MKDIVNPQIWECNTQVIPKVGLSIWDFTCDSQNGNWLFFPVEDFRGKDCAFVANWLQGKGLNKLCAVFEVFKF